MKDSRGSRFPFQRLEARKRVDQFGKVILVGSGKGGVGKSFVACAIALLLSEKGYRTGILDIDIHGASVPNYLDVRPPLKSSVNGLEPKDSRGVKVMSVALLAGDNPVPMRGGEKQGLITQLLALTDWGPLDFLVVDLPPSTGDELLSAFDLLAGKSSLVLVTTPSRNAINVVSRLRRLARTEKVPIEGVVVNMAYASETRSRRTFPFGRTDRRFLEGALDSTIIAEIPLEPKVNSQSLYNVLHGRNSTSAAFRRLVQRWTVKEGHPRIHDT
jgi:ATP-binding protein involved in chromosome partitioning